MQDWPAAQRLIERHAEALLAKGRGQTLRDWIVALPEATLENAPWSRYWLGTSLIPLNQKEARSHSSGLSGSSRPMAIRWRRHSRPQA